MRLVVHIVTQGQGDLVLADARLASIKQGRDGQPPLALKVALREELPLQGHHPVPRDLERLGDVAQVSAPRVAVMEIVELAVWLCAL